MKKISALAFIQVLVLGVIILMSHVPKDLTYSDVKVLNSLGIEFKELNGNFDVEIQTIKKIQAIVFSNVEFAEGVSIGDKREISDILNKKKGLCYDRSRLIEKLLVGYGLRTRHIFVLESINDSFLKSVTTKNIQTHAATEVETAKGWLIVDSIAPWLSLDNDGDPVELSALSENFQSMKEVPKIFTEKHFYIYGLYSRNGMMFPPFVHVPDINVWELKYNF